MKVTGLYGDVPEGSFQGRSRWVILGVLGITFLTFVYLFGIKVQYVAGAALIPLAVILLRQFDAVLLMTPLFLFLNITLSFFAVSELYIAFVVLSFAVSHKNITSQEIAFPQYRYFLLYGAVLLVSLIKSANPFLSAFALNHIFGFLALIAIIHATVQENRRKLQFIYVYLAGVCANTLHVYWESWSEGVRAFGFAGIMYVDFVSIGIVMTVILALTSVTPPRRVLFTSMSVFLTIGSILTQTRNTWISTIITLAIVFVVVVGNHEYFELSKRSIIRSVSVLAAVVIIGIGSAMLLNPKTLDRVSQSDKVEKELISNSGYVRNSFVSRLLIWHTAYNGFMANPILGIGAYSFPFSSQYYYTINKKLYAFYVERLTPHETFIAVTVETGIIGLIVFIILYINILRFVYRTLWTFSRLEDKRIALLLASSILYCHISMFTTDAWLWGHCLVLWGIVLGLFFSHSRNGIPFQAPAVP